MGARGSDGGKVMESHEMKKQCLVTVALLGAVLAVTGCSAPRGLQHKATRPVTENLDAPQDAVTAAFAATVGNLKPGQTVSVNLPEGGVGAVSAVRIGAAYKNALGESCRRVDVKRQGKTSTRAAVCLTKDGVWRYVAPGL